MASGKTPLFAQWLGGNMVLADQEKTTGRFVFVHSGTGTDAGGYGASPKAPVATIDYAVSLCTASKGDVIVVMPGHVEDLGDSETIDLDVIGITVVGQGVGSLRPRIDFNHADAGVDIGANDVTIRNLVFRPSVTVVAKAIDVETGVTGAVIENCEFAVGEAGDGTDEFVIAVELVSGNHDTVIKDSIFRTHAACDGCTAAIKLTAASSRVRIADNIMVGNWSTAAVDDGAACTAILIENNRIKVKDGEPGIELAATTTGIIRNNSIETTGLADADTAIVAADCSWFRNYAVVTDGKSDELIGAAESESIEGKVDSVGTLVTTADTAIDSVGTLVTTADTAIDSVGTLVTTADTAIDSVGTATDSVGTLVTTADTAIDSVGTLVTTLDNWDVRTVKKADLALDGGTVADVFAVANAPVELLGLLIHLTEAVSADACAMNIQSDPTSGAANTDMCDSVDINAAAIGDVIWMEGTPGTILANAANGTGVPQMCDHPQVVLPGGIDFIFANSTPSSGIADVYLVYRPLAANAIVTAP